MEVVNVKIHKGTACDVVLIGGLKEAPKLRDTKTGGVVATTRSTKEKSVFYTHTEWHRAVLYDHQALKVKTYAYPGIRLIIESDLRYRSIEPDVHKNKIIAEIIAHRVDHIQLKEINK
ncbi:MAG: hypothetical protein COB66_00670 [Coxiella sp. (in: Bacteria)]|nr:MAG: hypothetical protein COB66_00670 [Coxiella sp. (in: g-proteobacteria)]